MEVMNKAAQNPQRFQLSIAREVETRARASLGDNGYQAWAKSLPLILSNVMKKWDLRPVENVDGSGGGIIIRCEQGKNEVVIKSLYDRERLRKEFYALTA